MTTPFLFVLGLIGFGLVPMTGQDYLIGIGFTLLTWIALTQSWTILSGFAGYISLGHVVFFGIGGYFVVLTWETLPIWLSLPLASLITFSFAVVISVPVLRVRGPYFVILTFGLAEFVKYVVMAVEAHLGQFGRLLLGVPDLTSLYWLTLFLAATATLLTFFIRDSRFGQGLIAIREDEEAAQAIGIPVTRYKTLAYGLSAAIPGAIGGLMALRTSYFEPQQVFDPVVSFTILTMCIIGGSDNARGPILGAAFLTLLSELLWAKAPQLYLILLGLLLVTFVVILPNGIYGLFRRRTVQP
ncbi:MAG: branched-chain amino acid ABC transporter permease [Pseudorhodoplanes sp.]|uniref:branched-chain amino acid ABC transporter permease n=1 Tax=Pseudorhodoplanes sp. TaxID=1934341 RepID=UPI003D0C3654